MKYMGRGTTYYAPRPRLMIICTSLKLQSAVIMLIIFLGVLIDFININQKNKRTPTPPVTFVKDDVGY